VLQKAPKKTKIEFGLTTGCFLFTSANLFWFAVVAASLCRGVGSHDPKGTLAHRAVAKAAQLYGVLTATFGAGFVISNLSLTF
jgi:hypothetical protein